MLVMKVVEVIEFLWKEMNVEEIALSIAARGYFEHEPLFAVRYIFFFFIHLFFFYYYYYYYFFFF